MFFPYKDVDSRIHHLDARPKIVFVAVMFFLSILVSDILYLLFLFCVVMVVSAVARILRPTLGLLKYSLFVGIFILLFNLLISSGSTILFQWGWLAITLESLVFSISMVIRLFLTMASFSLLTFAVHPDELLRVLSRYGYRVTTGLSLATRMYPTIAADSGAIMDSMRARGVEMDEGGLIQKTKARAPVLMPLLLNSLDRSIGISEAMEARGFGSGRQRTNYSDPRLRPIERYLIISFLCALAFGVAAFVMGWGNQDYLYSVSFDYGPMDAIVLFVYGVLLCPILVGGSDDKG